MYCRSLKSQWKIPNYFSQRIQLRAFQVNTEPFSQPWTSQSTLNLSVKLEPISQTFSPSVNLEPLSQTSASQSISRLRRKKRVQDIGLRCLGKSWLLITLYRLSDREKSNLKLSQFVLFWFVHRPSKILTICLPSFLEWVTSSDCT